MTISSSASASSSISLIASSKATEARLRTDGPKVLEMRYSAADREYSPYGDGGARGAERIPWFLSGLDWGDEDGTLPSGVTGLKLSEKEEV